MNTAKILYINTVVKTQRSNDKNFRENKMKPISLVDSAYGVLVYVRCPELQ